MHPLPPARPNPPRQPRGDHLRSPPNRERECLVGERTRIVNRMKGTLARLGIRNFKPTLRKAAERFPGLAIRFRTLRELASIAGQRLHQ